MIHFFVKSFSQRFTSAKKLRYVKQVKKYQRNIPDLIQYKNELFNSLSLKESSNSINDFSSDENKKRNQIPKQLNTQKLDLMATNCIDYFFRND